MEVSKRGLIPWCLLLVLFACSWAVRAAHAQTPTGDDEDDEKVPPTLYVSVSLTEDGVSHVTWMDSQGSQATPAIKSVLQTALGCALQDSARQRLVRTGYQGSCRQPVAGTLLVHRIRIATLPLINYAREQRLEVLAVTIRLPDLDVAESEPHAIAPASYPGKISDRLKHMMELNRAYSWHVGAEIPEFIFVRTGYRQGYVAQAVLALLAALFAPALLVAWLGRRALCASVADKSTLWFSYMRYLKWILNVALMGWWIAAQSFHLVPLLRFFSAGSRFGEVWNFAGATTMVNWLPPAITWVLCFAFSHPVQEKLRGLSWTRRELALQALYSFCASLLPFALFLTGLKTIGTGAFRWAALWFLGAFVVKIVSSQALLKLLGMQPQALTTGDLRDRAFAMAQQLGVKLQQVYVIPSGKGQLANAFARTGNTISFTDFLLQRMSRPEVNYVLGHELTHLKLGHPQKLAGTSAVSIFLAIFVLQFANPYLHGSMILRYALIFGMATLFPYFWSRRFEYAADAGAVAATGDPEAAISALFKLAELNMLPIHWSHWSEKWLTHPSSLRRAQAIARKANILLERIPDIARGSSPTDGHYTLPASVTSGAKLHSTQRKQSGTLRGAFIMLAAIVFTPAAFAALAVHWPWHGPVRTGIYVAGFAVTLGVYIVAANCLPPMGLKNLAQSLKAKLAQENVLADSWDGTFVGFSPAAAPRAYELDTNWDVGCVFIRSDRICYVGEETRFALRREQITAILLAPGVPGLLRPLRVYVAWKDDDLAKSGAFNVGCISDSSILRLRRHTTKLAQRLELWRKSSAPARALPPPLADLTTPSIGAVTAASLHKGWKPGKVFKELFWTGLFAALGAVLCGLPFHLLAFLVSGGAPRTGMPEAYSPGAGWYVVGVAVAIRLIALIPMLMHKDRPAVFISPSRGQAPEPKTSGGTPSDSRERQVQPIPSR